jgi:hypothetical protein
VIKFAIIAFLASCLLAVIAASAPARRAGAPAPRPGIGEVDAPSPPAALKRIRRVAAQAGTNFSATPLLQ